MAELLSSKVVVLEAPPSIRSLSSIPTGLAAFVGIAKRGPVGVATLVTSFEEYVRIYGSYDANADMTLAVDAFFRNGGRSAFITRTVHYTDVTNFSSQTGLKSSYTIVDRGGAATAAQVDSAAGPWHLNVGDHFDLDFDNAGSQVATVTATPATRSNTGTTEPYNMTGSLTLTLKIDQGAEQTVTFVAGDFVTPATATAEEIVAAINKGIVGGQAYTITTGSEVELSSDTLGTASYIEVTGGTANAVLVFPTAEVQGTGNVADVTQVTPAEIAAMITILPPSASGTATVITGDKVRLASGATGAAAEVEVEATTVQRVVVFTPGVYLGSAAGTTNTLEVDGKYEGTYGDSVQVKITAATSLETDEFNMEVYEGGSLAEVFPNLSMTDTDSNYVEDVINDVDTGSLLIAVIDLDSLASSPNDLPALGSYTLTGGDDGLVGIVDVDWIGSSAGGTGFYSFDNVQDIAIGPLAPGRCTAAVQNAQVAYAAVDRKGSMFPILGPPAGNSKTQIVTYIGTTASLENSSEFGAFYWPRVKVLNPSTVVYGEVTDLTVDPVGAIAGTYVRTDNALPGGVYRAPAGLEYGQLIGVTGLENEDVLNEAVRDYVVPHRINPITTFQGAPIFIDGHDTLKGNGNFPSVPERRGVIYIEQTVKRGLEVFRHAPNDATTRGEVGQTIYAFLITQMRLRAFRSNDPDTAFSVDASSAVNPPSDEFAGKLTVKISLATNKPNKWIVLVFSQDVRALEEEIANS